MTGLGGCCVCVLRLQDKSYKGLVDRHKEALCHDEAGITL